MRMATTEAQGQGQWPSHRRLKCTACCCCTAARPAPPRHGAHRHAHCRAAAAAACRTSRPGLVCPAQPTRRVLTRDCCAGLGITGCRGANCTSGGATWVPPASAGNGRLHHSTVARRGAHSGSPQLCAVMLVVHVAVLLGSFVLRTIHASAVLWLLAGSRVPAAAGCLCRIDDWRRRCAGEHAGALCMCACVGE